MFELLGGGLLGSIFGGIFRLATEVLKLLDKKSERVHELSMFQLQNRSGPWTVTNSGVIVSGSGPF